MAWVDIQDGESMASVLAKLNALGQSAGGGGHARYHTTTGSVSTGVDIDTSELLEGDTILIQVEFSLDVLTNATYGELRFQTDEPSGVIDHIVQLGDMNKGTGTYEFAITHLIDLSGHTLTTKIPVEVRCTKAANVQPSALILQVTRGAV
jgi:hypothetical protein